MSRWTFYDGSNTRTFTVNPNAGGTPGLSKQLQKTPTSAPDGPIMLFEGRPKVPTGEFSGVVRSQTEYESLQSWFNARRQITVTDDLGRSFDVFITDLKADRAPKRNVSWRMTYTVSYVVLGTVDNLLISGKLFGS